ncbi:MAG: hypothetical protein LBJ46_02970 [Planctomycetota bacterium]|jgi:tetratricopeptide (TPR) repeat protein|nr:hypothetical protein [Planctomycetota bacterium]
MIGYHIAALLCFMALSGALFVRYVYLSVDREFRNLARAENDAEYRREELARVDRLLAEAGPPPGGAPPPARPPGNGWRLLPPAALALGALLLWGAAFAPRGEGRLWIWGGAGLSVASAAIMLASLRSRSRERVAGLYRYRADLRRLAGDSAGAAGDLRTLLGLTPWDDAAWSEYADDLAAAGSFAEARDAAVEASNLDPEYEDYRGQAVSFALGMGRPDLAKRDFGAWEIEIPCEREAGAARRLAYAAAIELAQGDSGGALARASEAKALDADSFWAAVDLDPSLFPLRDAVQSR